MGKQQLAEVRTYYSCRALYVFHTSYGSHDYDGEEENDEREKKPDLNGLEHEVNNEQLKYKFNLLSHSKMTKMPSNGTRQI